MVVLIFLKVFLLLNRWLLQKKHHYKGSIVFAEAPNSNIMKINEQENAIQNRIAIDSCTYLR
jgi:hypothetical protein